ncbi:DUF4442 domain-containing protein [Vibrio sp. SM6]|uniref:DUF4442 domain-containing protein n=1 Tax=Vibrio agarilyticus TaxID=2726741 RepID=A0A7X8TPU1_9VIBR|nr:DUF4442 domain-containing protein [Vibrio agarilyticus]NLS12540.1 DUF4442 domain-containing protein [Vibrio agarilyticus]
MLNSLQKANWYLRYFGWRKVPLIGLCRPKLVSLTDESVTVMIPLRSRTKNHLGSLYFGALAIGADVAGGFLAMNKAQQCGKKISLAFKGMTADFLKRPEANVYFHCGDGLLIDEMLAEAIATGQRINQAVTITAKCPSLHGDEVMAHFSLVLSIKVVN